MPAVQAALVRLDSEDRNRDRTVGQILKNTGDKLNSSGTYMEYGSYEDLYGCDDDDNFYGDFYVEPSEIFDFYMQEDHDVGFDSDDAEHVWVYAADLENTFDEDQITEAFASFAAVRNALNEKKKARGFFQPTLGSNGKKGLTKGGGQKPR